MPVKSDPKQVGSSNLNGVSVNLFELKAKTKDKDDKVTEFSYQFPKFGEDATKDDVVKALTYQNSKKETIDGWKVALDYINTALKNEKRSTKLAEINGILKLREDPEAAIRNMIDQMVLAYGVPREMAEANVRALIKQGAEAQAAATSPETTEPAK